MLFFQNPFHDLYCLLIIDCINFRHHYQDYYYNLLNNNELKLSLRNYLVSVNPDSPLDGTDNPDLNSALTVFECGSF